MWVLKGWDREEFGSSFVGLKLTLLTSCFFHGCFISRWRQEIMTDNAMYEDKSLVQDVAVAF